MLNTLAVANYRSLRSLTQDGSAPARCSERTGTLFSYHRNPQFRQLSADIVACIDWIFIAARNALASLSCEAYRGGGL